MVVPMTKQIQSLLAEADREECLGYIARAKALRAQAAALMERR